MEMLYASPGISTVNASILQGSRYLVLAIVLIITVYKTIYYYSGSMKYN